MLLPLCLVGFFSNDDLGLLSLGSPVIADGLDVSVATFGVGVAVIRLGALGGLVTLRVADRRGRRPMLLISVLGFTLLTGATAAVTGLVAFVAVQVLARTFLSTEETLASVVLTEELRPEHRGAGIGMLGIISTAGFGLVAVLLLAVDSTPLGWRLFYVVALVPLAVVLYLRRNLVETRAYAVAAAAGRIRQPWWPQLAPSQAGELRRLLIVLAAVGMLSTPAFFFAAELAQDDYGWEGLFTLVVFAAGDASVQAVRSAFAGELFPTEMRGTLGAVAGAVIVVAGSAGLLLTGVLASAVDPGATGLLLALLAAFSVLALRRLPETAGIDVLGPPTSLPGEIA